MARITDEYVIKQKLCRPNIDASHRCIFRCPQCIRQKTSSQEQIRRSFDLEEEQFKKILDYYDYGITFCGQISDPIYHPNFLNLLKISINSSCVFLLKPKSQMNNDFNFSSNTT